MNRSQRNIHKGIWLFLIVLIPLVFYFALNGINYSKSEAPKAHQLKENGATKVIDSEGLMASLVSNEQGGLLHIRLDNPLKSPSALVYTMDADGRRDQLLGQLEGVGEYSFEITSETDGIVLFDALRDIEFEKLEFSWE